MCSFLQIFSFMTASFLRKHIEKFAAMRADVLRFFWSWPGGIAYCWGNNGDGEVGDAHRFACGKKKYRAFEDSDPEDIGFGFHPFDLLLIKLKRGLWRGGRIEAEREGGLTQ